MAVKSSNIKGNPYHDEDGKFTSADDTGTKRMALENAEVQINQANKTPLRFKAKLDVNSLRATLQQAAQKSQNNQQVNPVKPQIGTYRPASTIDEAIQIGKAILPGCEVNYSSDCDITKVNELNEALSDIANRFPGFCQGGLLNAYGDGISLSPDTMKQIIFDSAVNVIKNDSHFSKIYDRFFEYSKNRFGTKDEEKYSPRIIEYFMCFDTQFDMRDYTQRYDGGGVLAYYQVSQDNMFDARIGGKGINGAIKFYPAILRTATPRELAAVQRQIDSGFHFDYGGHGHTYGTGVHELGHSIFTIAYKKCNDEERAEIDGLLRDGFGKDYNQLSGYGRRNAYEQEAEAVADVMCRGDKATLHNRKMVAWLDKVHARLKNGGEI